MSKPKQRRHGRTHAGPHRFTLRLHEPRMEGTHVREMLGMRLDQCRVQRQRASERHRDVFSGCISEDPSSFRMCHS